ncbi:MAG: nucleoside kinase [Candidatus Cloacimonetes bacterium]|nr:nucleoside kinase [Candidatus Cloacimonadota bacterium]MBL7085884.1 nucleoside kinase [Candidatus Cloacimonadota bacterium]
MEIKIIKNGKNWKTVRQKADTTPLKIINKHKFQLNNIITVAKVNNNLVSLEHNIDKSCILEYLDISSREGMRVYQDSLTLVLIQAAYELFENARVEVKHSLADGYYIETHSRFLLTESDSAKLRRRMAELISSDKKFILHYVTLQEAKNIFKNNKIKLNLLRYYKGKKILIYQFREIFESFNGPLVPSSGYLKLFDLKYVPPGIVLRFPTIDHPERIGKYHRQPNLLKIFTEYERWGHILDLSYVSALNHKIENYEIDEIIQVSEALHEKKIAQIAEDIYQKRNSVKLVLVSGPSASGKTTFAKRLAIQLKVNGLSSLLLSLDDYFLDRDKTPRDKFGEYDFESIGALDKNLVNKHVQMLLSDKEVKIPKFNFFKGKRERLAEKTRLYPNTILIVEGIHGLNDQLSPSIERSKKYKIYISALTQLNLDNRNRISTSDTRIIRRIVRDSSSRGYSAAETIKRWDSIRVGERKYVFTFQEESDAMFNSALVYELGVLKKYAIPALQKISPEFAEYSEAQRLIHLLSFFLNIPENFIPRNSIIREFI